MKRVHRSVLFSSIFVLLIVLSVLLETVSSNAAGWIGPYYLLQGGTGGTTSLVGEWRFDEANGTSAADSSGRTLNATLQNGPAWTSGRYRAGLSFDGVDDYVQVGAPPALVMTNALSLSAWINPTGAGQAGLGIIVSKEGEYEIARFADGTIRWAIANSAPGWNFIDTGFVAPLNQWTHLTLTYNNGQVKTYANGNLVHTYAGSGSIGDVSGNMNDFRIGGRQFVSQHFMGFIDEVSIYNQALTATDVQKLAQGSMPGNLAHGKPATQSSTGYDSPASRAVDGNTDGDWYHGSVSHTNQDSQAWWQVDLGSVQQIENVSVWMMTICCSTHDNFDVKVSSDGSNWTSYYVAGPIDQTNVPINRAARYVRVQLRGTGYLALAEVQVWGVPGAVMPGVIQAEDFDNGGEGISYHDLTPANEGGLYRTTAVDISSCSANNYVLGWNGSGEWTQYSINVPTAGVYTFQAVFGEESATGSLHVEIDGVNRTGPITIPATGGWCTLQTISQGGISLTPGQHMLRVVTDNVGVVLDSFRLVAETTPNAAAFVSQSVPTSMVAGQIYNVSVTMLNTGNNTWTTSGSYNLGTQNPQDNSTWGVTRVTLPNFQSVAPGQQVTFAFPTRAPETPGTYNFQTRMVQDTVEWFGALTPNVVVSVATPNQPPKASIGGVSVGMVHNPMMFSSAASFDPDGTITSYSWNFGDSQSSSDATPTHIYSTAGTYDVTLTVMDNAGATSGATMTVVVIEATQASYLNNSKVPGTIQAEDFDSGGPGVAYHDDSPGNEGGAATYRPGEHVDIEDNTGTGDGYAVSWTQPGEWLEYIVRVPDTDIYNFAARVAAPPEGGNGGVFHLEIDGIDESGLITIPKTGSGWTTVSKPGLRLTSGPHVLRIVMDSGGPWGYVGRFDYFTFTATQSPYGGTARALPGTIQVEDFDDGESGAAYSDTTFGNQGGAYRSTDVDIWNSSEGPAVGWTQKGEWWDYTVDVSQNGSYTFAVRAASPGAGAKFHLEIDEFVATQPITVPATGSRDAWQTIQTPVKLTTGRHIIRLVVDDVGAGGEVCFNSFTFSIPPPDPTKPPVDAALGPVEKYLNFDYQAFGVRNLVNPSNKGTFEPTTLRNVRHAFLFWWGVPNGILQPGRIKFAGKEEFGIPIAPASQGDILHGIESASFRLDVTATVARLGNVKYDIETSVTFGASLVVLYDDGNANNNRDIFLYAGNDGNKLYRRPIDGFVEPEGWDATLQGITYSGGGASVQLHVAEGERQPETLLTFSQGPRTISYPRPSDPFDFFGPDLFQGDSVPPFHLPEGGRGLWDIRNFDISSIVSNGSNTVRISAGRLTDTLFMVLAVVNVPHPVPTVTITDAKANTSNRVPGNLSGTTQKSLIGSPIRLQATGNTPGNNYKWTFTGPVVFVEGVESRTVSFETKDDRMTPNEPVKSVHKVTAKVVFTNDEGLKSEATVNIDVLLPALPHFEGAPGDSTVEENPDAMFPNTSILWQMGSSEPERKKPAMTFTARAQIPTGPILSNLEDSQITFQQAINVFRKVRGSWGKESCKTTRTTPEAFNPDESDLGWRRDDDDFPARVSEFQGATKHFGESTTANNSRSLNINFQEGVEGFKFENMRTFDKLGFNPHNFGTDMITVDAAEVDDRYETSVMYSSGSYSHPLATVKWRWSGTIAFDTSWQRDLSEELRFSFVPPTNPVSNYYIHIRNISSRGPQPQTQSTTAVAGSLLDSQFRWRQCPEGLGKPWPRSDFYPINVNQHGFVQLLYREALQRSPFDLDLIPGLEIPHRDRKGYHFWASNITRNGFNDDAINGYRVHVALAFLFSGDLRDLHQDENDPLKDLASERHTPEYYRAFVWACYKVFLQRNPGEPGRFTDGDRIGDMSGLDFWVEKLRGLDALRADDQDDYAFFETVAAFIASQEYKQRTERDPDLKDFFDDILENFNNSAPRFTGPLQ